jgi:hypothetical protein
MDVLRRITALLAMIALVGLLLLLIWHVQWHHDHGSETGEPLVVTIAPHTLNLS